MIKSRVLCDAYGESGEEIKEPVEGGGECGGSWGKELIDLNPSNGSNSGLEDGNEAAEEGECEVGVVEAVAMGGEANNRELTAGHEKESHNQRDFPGDVMETGEEESHGDEVDAPDQGEVIVL